MDTIFPETHMRFEMELNPIPHGGSGISVPPYQRNFWFVVFFQFQFLLSNSRLRPKDQELTLLSQFKTLAPAAVRQEQEPHLIFQRREGTRGLKFGTQTKLTIISSGNNSPKDICPCNLSLGKQNLTLIPTGIGTEIWPLIKVFFSLCFYCQTPDLGRRTRS